MKGWGKIRVAAGYAGISDRTLEDWLKQGLKYVRLPTGTRLLKYEWIDEYLESFVEAENQVDTVVNEMLSDL